MGTKYSISNIGKIAFESMDIPVCAFEKNRTTSYRLTASQVARFPEYEKNINSLRMRMSELFHEKLGNSYAKLEANCDIKRDTFQKIMKFKNGKNITYSLLAKFCIGINLSVKESRELFLLIDYDLHERNKADYILLCELENGCDIFEYDIDMKKYCGKSILSEADKVSSITEI